MKKDDETLCENVYFNQDVSNYVINNNSVIKKDDYVEVDDIPFVNIMKRIMENITKSQDKATREKDHVMNNVSDNIDDVVNDFVTAGEGSISKNNEIHDGSAFFNEGVTKDGGLSKRPEKNSKKIVGGQKIPTNVYIAPLDNVSFHCEESVLKWKYLYHKRIDLERNLSK